MIAVVFEASASTCVERVMLRCAENPEAAGEQFGAVHRKGHPTLKPGPRAKGIVNRLQQQLVPPDASEGFDSIFYTDDRHSPVFDEILDRMVNTTRSSSAKDSISMDTSANAIVGAKPKRTAGNMFAMLGNSESESESNGDETAGSNPFAALDESDSESDDGEVVASNPFSALDESGSESESDDGLVVATNPFGALDDSDSESDDDC